jgi:hypothetical protein
VSAGSWQALVVEDPQLALAELAGGDPFDDVYRQSQAHQRVHGCGLFPAGPAVMLTSMFVRAARARSDLDLGCGIGYSTFWLAKAVTGSTLTAIDSDAATSNSLNRPARDSASKIESGSSPATLPTCCEPSTDTAVGAPRVDGSSEN